MSDREFPATVGQRLLWLMDRYRGAHGGLNTSMAVRLTGRFDVVAWQRALDALTARHEALRTTFAGRGRRLVQTVHDPRPAPLTVTDLGSPDDLAGALAHDARTPVDVTVWPLRCSVWRVAEDDTVIALTIHHLANDAWSFDVIWRDLCRHYNGEPAAEPPVWQFADFARWQAAEVLQGPRFQELEEYWRERADAPTPVLPPGEGPREGAVATVDLEPHTVTALNRTARRRRATPFALHVALFGAALHAVSGSTDVTVATLFANRPRPEEAQTVGFLANLLPLRVHSGAFDELVTQVKREVLDGFLHQDLPYQVFPAANQGGADDVVFNAHARHPADDPDVHFAGAVARWLPPDPLACRFDLEFRIVPEDGAMRGWLFYNKARVAPPYATELAEQYRRLCLAQAST